MDDVPSLYENSIDILALFLKTRNSSSSFALLDLDMCDYPLMIFLKKEFATKRQQMSGGYDYSVKMVS